MINRQQIFYLLCCAALGFLSAKALHRDKVEDAETPAEIEKSVEKKSAVVELTQQSYDNDTLETISSLPLSHENVARVMQWIFQANESDVFAYVEFMTSTQQVPSYFSNLVFQAAVRANSQRLIEITKNTKYSNQAWIALARLDPQQSLQAALAMNDPRHISDVIEMICQQHPTWCLENIALIPDDFRYAVIKETVENPSQKSIAAQLDFLIQSGTDPNLKLLEKFIQTDCLAAYEWLEKNRAAWGSFDQKTIAATFASALSDATDTQLQNLLIRIPTGELKKQINDKLFEKTLETNLSSAESLALNTKSTTAAIERLSSVGSAYVRNDPEHAFQLAENIFQQSPDVIHTQSPVLKNLQCSTFLKSLMAVDAPRVMNLQIDAMEKSGVNTAFNTIAEMWANQDFPAYEKWLLAQNNEELNQISIPVMVDALSYRGHYNEAASWVMRNPLQTSAMDKLLIRWKKTDPDAALLWVQTTSLPPEKISEILHEHFRSKIEEQDSNLFKPMTADPPDDVNLLDFSERNKLTLPSE